MHSFVCTFVGSSDPGNRDGGVKSGSFFFSLLTWIGVRLRQRVCVCQSVNAIPHNWMVWTIITSTFVVSYFSLCSFLNSCVNPVALYCVSGVFRQHFHRYLCCKPLQQPHHRLGMSSATGACDTSFMSTIRRTNTHHGNNNALHNGSSPTQSIILSEKRWGTIISQDTFL